MALQDEVLQKATRLAEDYQQVFGPDLISVILYGSALTSEYLPRKSDLNFLIVLTEKGIEELHLAHGLVVRWRKQRVGTPLFLTRAYISSSLETFPIEFLNIRRNYRVINGEDVLADLVFHKEHIRMQCEHELKGKLLLLRQRYVEAGGKSRILRTLLVESLPTFLFVFRALLYLLDKEIPATKKDTIHLLATELQLDEELFLTLLKMREQKLKLAGSAVVELFRQYLKEIRRLALLMDEYDFAARNFSSQEN
ncbi:MAG: hypothetical protein JRJ12_00420 [Deltaproteobacteria bacterium]|nr:hypothetical protein [Deltaproteobacteria bacterium]MBW2069829.1 hypothetical protein [Deltaproteobacteria bacterium]